MTTNNLDDALIKKLRKKLKSRKWRLNNLYYITDKAGKRVKFKMTREQLDHYDNEHNRNIILKARQLGFTTLICIVQLDAALFEGKKCALIAHTLHDAKRLFREKTQFAYNNLPDMIKQSNPVQLLNTDEIVFSKGGSVTVSTSFRGGTLQRLHVSEFGKICAKFPEKAREIITGALQAVGDNGIATFESTAEGRSGYFYDYCQESQKLIGKTLNKLQFKFFFYSWWQNPSYTLEGYNATIIPERLREYFSALESLIGVTLQQGQKAWYAAKEADLGDDIFREYPSTPDEAFKQAVEGAYYIKQFQKLYKSKQILDSLPNNSHLPVMTFWDLGVSDSTVIWFVRKISNKEYHIIDYYENSGEGLEHYAKVLLDKGYEYEGHYAPHDVDTREFAAGAKSLKQVAAEGFEINGTVYKINFITVGKTSKLAGIEQVRSILPFCYFDATKCEQGITALESYRKEWDDKAGAWRNSPLHDWSSHAADGFRYFAVAMLSIKPAKNTRRNRKKIHMN